MNYFCQFQRSLPNRSGGLRRCILGTEVFFSIYLRFLFSFSISYLFIFVFHIFSYLYFCLFKISPCLAPSHLFLPSAENTNFPPNSLSAHFSFSSSSPASLSYNGLKFIINIIGAWIVHIVTKKLWKTVHHHNHHHHKYHNDKNHHLKTITKSK